MEIKHQVYLSLGSNLGDRLNNLNFAIDAIERIGEITKKSSIYECKAIGFESNDLFYNCCVEIQTSLTPFQLLKELNVIEKNAGRIRFNDGQYHSRNLDIDILFFQDKVINHEDLIIPHPKYHERNFVLIPLFEIGNELIDPKQLVSISQILSKCKDKSVLKKIKC